MRRTWRIALCAPRCTLRLLITSQRYPLPVSSLSFTAFVSVLGRITVAAFCVQFFTEENSVERRAKLKCFGPSG